MSSHILSLPSQKDSSVFKCKIPKADGCGFRDCISCRAHTPCPEWTVLYRDNPNDLTP